MLLRRHNREKNDWPYDESGTEQGEQLKPKSKCRQVGNYTELFVLSKKPPEKLATKRAAQSVASYTN